MIEDKRTNNVTLVEHIEKLTLTVPPDIPPVFNMKAGFVLASQWFNDRGNDVSGLMRITMTAPPAQVEGKPKDIPLNIPAHSFARVYGNIEGFQVQGQGVYWLVVYFKADGKKRWKRMATIPLQVVYNIVEGTPFIEVPMDSLIEASNE